MALTPDCPVLDNGLVRVRFDPLNVIGFIVEVWNGSAYVPQGKMVVRRIGDVTGYDNVWVSSGLVEWTPDRAVASVVLTNSLDSVSRERVFITVQRGEIGASFECYPAPVAAGTNADAEFMWTPAPTNGVADANQSALKIDSIGTLSTTVAAGSNGVNVNTFTGTQTLNVASIPSPGWGGSGIAAVATGSGVALVSYTGGGTTASTTLTGCTLIGGVTSGTLATGGSVGPALPGSWTPGAAAATQNSGPTPGVFAATASSSPGQFSAGFTTLGNADFASSENWAALLRCTADYKTIASYQQTLVVLQATDARARYHGVNLDAYGITSNAYYVASQNAAGYLQCQVQFGATQSQQVMEAEAMTRGSGTTAGGDPTASGAATTQASRTTDANLHVSQANWPNSFGGTFRVFIRTKNTNTASYYAKTGATTGATVTVTGAATPTYKWVDLGEIVANNTTLEIHAWSSGGAGIVEVDRVEAVLVQDRIRTSAIYSGARDVAQAALFDSRQLGAVVAR